MPLRYQTLHEYIEAYLAGEITGVRVSRNRLAKRAGISERTVRRILAGEDVTHETLNQLADAVGVDAHFLYRLAGYLSRERWSDVDPRIRKQASRYAELPLPLKEIYMETCETLLNKLEEALGHWPEPEHNHITLDSDDEHDNV